MDKENSMSVLSPVIIVGGLAILLYGVSLNSGEAMNTPMVAGGVVVLIGIGILAFFLMSLEEEGEEPA